MTKRHRPGQLITLVLDEKNNFIYGILLREKASYIHQGKVWKALLSGKIVDVFSDGDVFIKL